MSLTNSFVNICLRYLEKDVLYNKLGIQKILVEAEAIDLLHDVMNQRFKPTKRRLRGLVKTFISNPEEFLLIKSNDQEKAFIFELGLEYIIEDPYFNNKLQAVFVIQGPKSPMAIGLRKSQDQKKTQEVHFFDPTLFSCAGYLIYTRRQ